MKKIVLILSMIMVLFTSSLSFATSNVVNSGETVVQTTGETFNSVSDEQFDDAKEEITPATDKILDNMSKKDRKIAEYTVKYNDKTMAYVAYYLDLIQLYSIPVCIIGLTIGAFNFYIIGEKKLDKREQGFGYIRAFLGGLVFFQVLPLIFALLVAGK